jgi:hypothetical protein
VPEAHSNLKVVIREDFGVNTEIKLCDKDNHTGEINCEEEGEQIGTTEILYYEGLDKGKEYFLKFFYLHSILPLHKFEVCPHLPVEISMISVEESEAIQRNINHDKNVDKESKKKLKTAISKLSEHAKYIMGDNEEAGHFTMVTKEEEAF